MEWKPVKGYEGRYEVSDCGQIRKYQSEFIGQWLQAGYCRVKLSQPRKAKFVHRLVAEAFIPNPNNLPHINHKDFITQNNNVRNLEWCTQEYNIKYSHRAGRYPQDYWKGKRSLSAALTDAEANKAREMYADGGWSYERLGKHLGVSKRTIHRIVKRLSYV